MANPGFLSVPLGPHHAFHLEGGLGDGDGVLQQKLDLHHQGMTALVMCCLCHFKLENL